ncbi:gsto1: putative protein [Crotalus adamanteus]|uniref:Glutathione-dependent dehydroascorbate reductase n=1 Tax=Crotalus adamanteus TaxID=8729 RepID=A0AAW1BGJ4_CROAD
MELFTVISIRSVCQVVYFAINHSTRSSLAFSGGRWCLPMKRDEPNCFERLVKRKEITLGIPMCTVGSVFCLMARSKMSGEFAKSLGKGTLAPGPVPEGIIRIYSMRHCPFAQRTLLVLKAKGIKTHLDWYLCKGTTSKGQLISESPITCEYLDEAYPENKLYPADPYEKAYQKMLLEYFSKVPPICISYARAIRNGEDASALKNEYQKKLLKLEEMLANHKTKFFGGNSVSMIDYLIWPWCELIEAFQLLECLDHTPGLKCWIDRMKLDPAVKATITDPQIFKSFLELYFNNSIESCDFGL